MKQKTNRLLIFAVLFALVLPFVIAGNASAKYNGDGSVPDGTGGWVTPNDMVCIKGLHADGTLDIVAGVTNSRDCIYNNTDLKTMDPVDVTASSVCGTTTAGPFNLSCNSSANCKFTNPASAATWNSTDSKCYDSSPCTKIGAVGNDGAKHALATSICVDGSGNGLSLAGLDRTYSMCVSKGGTWKQTSATAPYVGAPGTYPTPNFGGSCVAYNRQFKGQSASGIPLAFGTEGTVQAAGTGACYAKMRTGIAVASCPSIVGSANGTKTATSTAAFGYAATATQCTYDYGVNGAIDALMVRADGTTVAAGTTVNLSAYTTMGDCLFNGGTWANWIPMSTTATIGSITGVTFDLTRQSVNADDGCLHCHSTKTEYNGPAEREKDSYLKTGHKNMLRKVTAGQTWAGPNDAGVITPYTDYAAGSINWAAATAQVAGVDKPLMYIFGDWMAPAPGGLDVVVDMGTADHLAKYNGTSNYSCAACHTAGWSNPGPGTCSNATASSLGSLDQATCEAAGKVWTDPGLCSLSSKKSQSACTTAGGTWYPSIGVQAIGTPNYHGTQPADAFPSATFQGAGTWDNEGITCGRCHNAAWPQVSATQIAASIYTTTDPVGQNGMGTLNAGVKRTSLCFGCHQSMAATSNGTGTDVDLTNPTALIVKNTATAPAYTPGFSGHVLGNSFLNSPHARFTGTVQPNSLGKYDLVTNTSANYNSTFRGYTCWQTPTSTSPAKTKADGTEIKTKSECETLYGAGSWRPDTNNGTLTDANSIQGTCTTCHDVHQSLFVTGQEGLRKECDSCHDNATYAADVNTATGSTPFQASTINHPTGTNTPSDVDPISPCVVCHMPKPTPADFPMHVWRIKSDAAYSTFPTALEFGIGGAATRKNANTVTDSKGYTNAVWVDLSLACQQCHGSAGPAKHQFSKGALATYATVMHNGGSTPPTDCLGCHNTEQGTIPAIKILHHQTGTGTPSLGNCKQCHDVTATAPATGTSYIGVAPNIQATCGQCHGGGTDAVTNPPAPGVPYYFTLAALQTLAQDMHASSKGAVPDLQITSVSAPTTGVAGGSMTITDITTNTGLGSAAASTTSFYLSTNVIWDAGDTLLTGGSRAVGVLAVGATSPGSTTVSLPNPLAAGTYYIIAKADSAGVVTELSETNNELYSKAIVVGGVDLRISSLTTTGTISAGATISVNDVTMNAGAGTAGASTTRFYSSTNAVLDAVDTALGSGRAVGSLTAGATSTGTTSVTIPSPLSAGTYYILAKADAGLTPLAPGVVAETSETNNELYKAIVIGPDLKVGIVGVLPASIIRGNSIIVSDMTINYGNATAGASTTKYYLSTTPALGGTAVQIGTARAVGSLTAGASSTGPTTITIPVGTTPGTYYVIAKADAGALPTDAGVVAESNETNNTSIKVVTVTGP